MSNTDNCVIHNSTISGAIEMLISSLNADDYTSMGKYDLALLKDVMPILDRIERIRKIYKKYS